MQRVCTKCNTLVTGDGAFCPSCGEPLPAAVQLEKTPQTTPMGASQQNDVMPSANSIPNYSQQNGYTIITAVRTLSSSTITFSP